MILAGGFIDVDDLLQQQQFKGFNLTDIQQVVSNCSKQRFSLKQDPSTHKTYVRANQGHTLEVSGKLSSGLVAVFIGCMYRIGITADRFCSGSSCSCTWYLQEGLGLY